MTFKNPYKIVFDRVMLSNAIEWYAGVKGIVLVRKQRTIYRVDNYPVVTMGQKRIAVHRLLMSYSLNRELASNEHVHHRDGNTLNGILSNFKITTNPKHGVHHHKRKDISDRVIERMLKEGKSQADIAQHFNICVQTINRRIRHMREET